MKVNVTDMVGMPESFEKHTNAVGIGLLMEFASGDKNTEYCQSHCIINVLSQRNSYCGRRMVNK